MSVHRLRRAGNQSRTGRCGNTDAIVPEPSATQGVLRALDTISSSNIQNTSSGLKKPTLDTNSSESTTNRSHLQSDGPTEKLLQTQAEAGQMTLFSSGALGSLPRALVSGWAELFGRGLRREIGVDTSVVEFGASSRLSSSEYKTIVVKNNHKSKVTVFFDVPIKEDSTGKKTQRKVFEVRLDLQHHSLTSMSAPAPVVWHEPGACSGFMREIIFENTIRINLFRRKHIWVFGISRQKQAFVPFLYSA